MKIRKAELDDAGALAEILRGLGWFGTLESEPEERTRERVGRHLALYDADESHSIYVAEGPAGEVVGYVGVHWLPSLFLTGPEGLVSELFVAAPARGQGAGTKLMEAVQEEAAARGCSRLQVINRRNRESYRRGFYEKCGWVERPEAASLVYSLHPQG
jgi:GNAT superfamily N-acetyltransferase